MYLGGWKSRIDAMSKPVMYSRIPSTADNFGPNTGRRPAPSVTVRVAAVVILLRQAVLVQMLLAA